MEKRRLVIRTAHTGVEMVRTALASITRIGNRPVALRVLAVSGTIKALYKKTKP
jgi:RNase P/RNase MRP subunit POP5